MDKLIKKWKKRMVRYRHLADEKIDNPILRIKYMTSFMMLRDCIKELNKYYGAEFYCRNEIEGHIICGEQCSHCKSYYKPIEN